MSDNPTAAVLLIGDEILSGRTRDSNLQTIAQFLAPLGVDVRESRLVADDQGAIIAALNALRGHFDYVFTTGGIGPTHDDITADSVAAAFGVGIDERGDALDILKDWYAREGTEFTPARRRMARIPDGAVLIDNPVTGAPGFQIENVFVMAGVPKIMKAMLEDIAPRLKRGRETRSTSIKVEGKREGDLADMLRQAQAEHPDVAIGSYPHIDDDGGRSIEIILRAGDESKLGPARERVEKLLERRT